MAQTKSPIALINELTVSCQESYDSWKCIYNGGGSDPFWADGIWCVTILFITSVRCRK